jgi:hypothetical protein
MEIIIPEVAQSLTYSRVSEDFHRLHVTTMQGASLMFCGRSMAEVIGKTQRRLELEQIALEEQQRALNESGARYGVGQ